MKHYMLGRAPQAAQSPGCEIQMRQSPQTIACIVHVNAQSWCYRGTNGGCIDGDVVRFVLLLPLLNYPSHANSKYVLQIAGGDDDCTQDNDDQPRRRPMVMPLKGTAED